jgi:lipid-A-disaccharide synthase
MTNNHSPGSESSNTPVRIFISTGEVSGDLQGALLIAALQRQAQTMNLNLEIVALGGDRMAAAGAKLLGHTSGIGSIGLLESLPLLLPTLRTQQQAKAFLRQFPPDLVVLIDYMGPNLGMGWFLRQHCPQVPIVYYIAPQEWVWSINQRNTNRIAQITDRLLAIFPAEAEYYQTQGIPVTWVGHPLLDQTPHFPNRDQARSTLGIGAEDWAITLLPASRPQELRYLLPVIFEAARRIQAQLPTRGDPHHPLFWIPLSLEVYRRPIEQAITAYGLRAQMISAARDWERHAAIAAADLAITKSGTVSLEIALMQVPHLVIYRVSPATAWVARLLRFSIPFMSPPNLVQMQPIVPELLQEQANPEQIVRESLDLLLNAERRQQMQDDYQHMRQALGEVGVCDRAAREILQQLSR